jgi:hypothetical protein
VLQQRVTIVKRRQALIRDKPGRLAQLRVNCAPPWTRPKSEAGHVAPMADVETVHFCTFCAFCAECIRRSCRSRRRGARPGG